MKNVRKLALGLTAAAALVLSGTIALCATAAPASPVSDQGQGQRLLGSGRRGFERRLHRRQHRRGSRGYEDHRGFGKASHRLEIAKVTPESVNTVILTHSDVDHVNGLAAFPAGLSLSLRKRIVRRRWWPPLAAALPRRRIGCPRKPITRRINSPPMGVRIRLYHWAPGHTSGDTVVYLPDEKTVFGGDLLAGAPDRAETLIHLEKNGSTTGWIENVKGMLGLNADIYLTGHGNMMTKAEVQKKLELVQDKYNKVKTMVAQGKSLDEIKTSLGEPTAYAAAQREMAHRLSRPDRGHLPGELSKKS